MSQMPQRGDGCVTALQSRRAVSLMAGTRFAYVRSYEQPDPLLPNTFLVVRVDGHAFHRFSDTHGFEKPNDMRALELMNHAAKDVMEAYPDIVLAFGESDEFSFLLHKSCTLFSRRHSKILTSITSHFTSAYVFHWSAHFPNTRLEYPPSFDGRVVVYPTEREVKDYFAWRQADTHINNLYNTTFWALVQRGGLSTAEAHSRLKGTVSKNKHEILFSQFGINYNGLPAIHRKGSVLLRGETTPGTARDGQEGSAEGGDVPDQTGEVYAVTKETGDSPVGLAGGQAPRKLGIMTSRSGVKGSRQNGVEGKETGMLVQIWHCDVISPHFWEERQELLD